MYIFYRKSLNIMSSEVNKLRRALKLKTNQLKKMKLANEVRKMRENVLKNYKPSVEIVSYYADYQNNMIQIRFESKEGLDGNNFSNLIDNIKYQNQERNMVYTDTNYHEKMLEDWNHYLFNMRMNEKGNNYTTINSEFPKKFNSNEEFINSILKFTGENPIKPDQTIVIPLRQSRFHVDKNLYEKKHFETNNEHYEALVLIQIYYCGESNWINSSNSEKVQRKTKYDELIKSYPRTIIKKQIDFIDSEEDENENNEKKEDEKEEDEKKEENILTNRNPVIITEKEFQEMNSNSEKRNYGIKITNNY